MKDGLAAICISLASLWCSAGWCAGAQSTAPSATQAVAQPAASGDTFTNPLLPSGADPWVLVWKGNYFYMNTTQRTLTVWKTRDLGDLRDAQKKVVWTPEVGQPWSTGVWAPELHRWGRKWYIYFAADGGKNESHRIFVIENASADPMNDEWTMKGEVADVSDKWAIDPDLFKVNGMHYMLWSGWKGDTPRGTHIDVNKGPEALVHDGKVFVFFSASGCWTDHYALGAVVASERANLLDAASWTKFDRPLLSEDAAHSVYAPGHNGFLKSPDGKQDWIIYHANPEPGQGCGGHRSPRMQRFTWNVDGTPNLGEPVAAGVPLHKPQ